MNHRTDSRLLYGTAQYGSHTITGTATATGMHVEIGEIEPFLVPVDEVSRSVEIKIIQVPVPVHDVSTVHGSLC